MTHCRLQKVVVSSVKLYGTDLTTCTPVLNSDFAKLPIGLGLEESNNLGFHGSSVKSICPNSQDDLKRVATRQLRAYLRVRFPIGKHGTETIVKTLHGEPHAFCPPWNYTIHLRLGGGRNTP
jgi:hypothetical protein